MKPDHTYYEESRWASLSGVRGERGLASDEERSRALVELQILDQLLSELQVRIAAINNSIADHDNAVTLLEELEKSRGKRNMLIPVGGGSYLHGRVSRFDVVKVGVGAGVVLERTPADARVALQNRRDSLAKLRDSYTKRLMGYLARADELRSIIRQK